MAAPQVRMRVYDGRGIPHCGGATGRSARNVKSNPATCEQPRVTRCSRRIRHNGGPASAHKGGGARAHH